VKNWGYIGTRTTTTTTMKNIWAFSSYRLLLPRERALTACLQPASWRKGPNYPPKFWHSDSISSFGWRPNKMWKWKKKKKRKKEKKNQKDNNAPLCRTQSENYFLSTKYCYTLSHLISLRFHIMLRFTNKTLLAYHVSFL